MPAAFLHGVETFNMLAGPRAIAQPRSAVIGIVGTAPIHHVDGGSPALPSIPTLVASDTDRAKLGPELAGYTIPQALRAISDKGAGIVIVINLFDPTNVAHQTSVASATRTITPSKTVVLPHGDLISVTVTTSADAPCASPADYTVNRQTGVITITPGGLLSAAVDCKVAYVRANPAAVVAADIVGSTTVGGVRLGSQAFKNCRNLFGFAPKILISPGFITAKTVETALTTLAQSLELRAHVLVDVPVGTSVSNMISGRGPSGSIDLRSSDERVHYCGPHLKREGVLEPFSQHLAGVIAATDAERGYWHSPSNKPIAGIDGTELPIGWALNDPNCEANLLNAAGIITAVAGFGTGIRTWGNRSAAFPARQDILTFMATRRTVDMVDDAIEAYTLNHVDGPIGQVLIDAVLEDVGAFLRTMVSRKALFPGAKVEALPEKNPPVQLSAGQIVFTRTICPPPPAERITHETVVDTSLLKIG